MPRIIYKNAEGKRVPSVTTILKMLGWSTEGLIWWAYKVGADGGDLNEARKGAADVGTIAHAAIEADIKNEDFSVELVPGCTDEMREQVGRCLESWFRWRQQNNLTMLSAELSLVSEEHQYGGTMDIAAIYGDQRRVIIDIKTGGSIYPDHLCQIAAYAKLWEEHHPDSPISEYHLIRLGKNDGSFHHHAYVDLDDAWLTFLSCRDIYDRHKRLKKMV